MHHQPPLTVGIPFHGSDLRTLELAVRSVFAQDFSDWELLLIDDGAHSSLVDRMSSIDDPRVRLLSDGRRLGLAARLNQLAHVARSSVLVRMDSDDIMRPDRLRRQLSAFQASLSPDILASLAYVIDSSDRVEGIMCHSLLPGSVQGFLSSDIITHPTVAARRQFLLDHPYRTDIGSVEDKDLWLRIAAFARFQRDDVPNLFYRVATIPDRAKLIHNDALDRRLVLTHAYRLGGIPSAARRLPRLALRATIYRFGPKPILQRIRERHIFPLADEERAVLQDEISDIACTEVPGW